MNQPRSRTPARSREGGFTLIEVLLGTALMAMVIGVFLSMRSQAVLDAAIARDWRIARDIAERYLSEMEAGAREFEPNAGERYPIDDLPGFSFEMVVGEARISQAESRLADESESGPRSDSTTDRSEWQRERDTLRRARSRGVTMEEYNDQLVAEQYEDEQLTPTEIDFEDVAIIVYFPNVRNGEGQPETLTFMLKSKISTMAIMGLTPDRAEVVARQMGTDPGAASPAAAPGAGTDPGAGTGDR